MKYIDLIKKGKEALDAIKAPFIAAKAEKDLEVKILDIQQKIAESDLTIQEEKSKNPTNWDLVVDKLDNKDLLGRSLKQLQELKEELF